MSCPNRAICKSPARTTASTAVERYSGLDATRQHALDHLDLHAAFGRALQVNGIHEIADQEDAAAARLQEILRRQRIRNLRRLEALALIAHLDRQLGNVVGYLG